MCITHRGTVVSPRIIINTKFISQNNTKISQPIPNHPQTQIHLLVYNHAKDRATEVPSLENCIYYKRHFLRSVSLRILWLLAG